VADDDAIATELLALGSATLGESGAGRMAPRIKPAWRGARLAARAFPVVCGPGDNLAIHVAVTESPAGRALVVDASAVPELGYWGEVLTTGAEARDLRGLVIDGGVRDVDALEQHAFPVFSALIALPGAKKVAGGSVGGTAGVAGVEVGDGDWVVGDADGVVVVPRGSVADVLAAGRARADKEHTMFDKLRAGETTITLLGLDPTKVDRG